MLGVGEDRVGRAHGTGRSETTHLQNSSVLDTYDTLSQFTKDSNGEPQVSVSAPALLQMDLLQYRMFLEKTGKGPGGGMQSYDLERGAL